MLGYLIRVKVKRKEDTEEVGKIFWRFLMFMIDNCCDTRGLFNRGSQHVITVL